MRIPLQDICAGSGCRFFRNEGEALGQSASGVSIPCIYYLYDKTEDRIVEHKGLATARHWWELSVRTIETKITENIRYYHVVEMLYEPYWTQNPYCMSFRSVIAKAARCRGGKVDQWLCDLTDFQVPGHITSNCHQWIPLEKLGEYKDPEANWQDSSKCPSFVAYPVAEVGGQNDKMAT